jgi:hypothetical protein
MPATVCAVTKPAAPSPTCHDPSAALPLLHESNGYPDNVPLPDYRTWGTRIVAHFIDEIASLRAARCRGV